VYSGNGIRAVPVGACCKLAGIIGYAAQGLTEAIVMAADHQRYEPGPDQPVTRNESTASVAGHLVQARSITGGVHLYGVPRQVPVPRQLPPAPTPFVGRDDELTMLTHSLDQARPADAVVISALAGIGGIGKTTLALHWAHRNKDRFPDGQLFVNLRGFDPKSAPLSPDAALHGFLLALGVDAQAIPPDLDGKTGVYRTRVASKRMLIVLDNAATADQVEPLLPGSPACAVLVTSRKMLTALTTRHGARHVALPILSQEEARALLAERLGEARRDAEPGAAAELIRLCGCHPLALALIASRAYIDPGLSLAELAKDLSYSVLVTLEDGDPASSLPDVLSWSLRGLTGQQRTVFGLLGIAPGPDISLPAAVSLTGLPSPRAKKVLRELEQASLLNPPLGGRYSMHDLIRAFAADTATGAADLELADNTAGLELAGEVREAAQRRVIDFYLHTAYAAARVLAPHRQPIQLELPVPGCHPEPLAAAPAALAWFDTEHSCLLESQRTAAALGWQQAVWALAWTLHTFHRRRGHRHDEVTAWKAALEAAAHLSDPASRALARQYLGRIYAYLEQHEEASEQLRQALALAEQHHDPANQAHARILLSWAWEQRGDGQRALEHATRALALYRTLGNPVWEGRALNQVGWYAAHLGDYDRARELCEAALPLHRHRYPDGEASTLDTLGYIDHRTGRYQQAVQHYQQALILCHELGDTYEAASTLDRLGHSHAALGHYGQARTVWREALDLCQAQHRTEDVERIQRQLDALGQQPGSQ
jgi:tetratricopeptide (TPR) repeat protein